MTVDLARMRLDYETAGIDAADLHPNPLIQLSHWLEEAVGAELVEPNAMIVSTVDAEGQPWSRHVLAKGLTEDHLDFYTNYRSTKSVHLGTNPKIAATFTMLGLHRQVNLAGVVAPVPAEESDRYWAVRSRGSQLGAWASNQSEELTDRGVLLGRYDEVLERFGGDGDSDSSASTEEQPDLPPVPRPEHWGGWRIVPHSVEFWQGRRNRLHDRIRYRRNDVGEWTTARLSP